MLLLSNDSIGCVMRVPATDEDVPHQQPGRFPAAAAVGTRRHQHGPSMEVTKPNILLAIEGSVVGTLLQRQQPEAYRVGDR